MRNFTKLTKIEPNFEQIGTLWKTFALIILDMRCDPSFSFIFLKYTEFDDKIEIWSNWLKIEPNLPKIDTPCKTYTIKMLDMLCGISKS